MSHVKTIFERKFSILVTNAKCLLARTLSDVKLEYKSKCNKTRKVWLLQILYQNSCRHS